MKVKAGTGKPLLYVGSDLLITIVIMKKRISEKTSYFEFSVIIAKNVQFVLIFESRICKFASIYLFMHIN